MKKAAFILLLLVFCIFFLLVGWFLGKPGGISLGVGVEERMRKNCYEPVAKEFESKKWQFKIGQIQKYMQMMWERSENLGIDASETIQMIEERTHPEEVELMKLTREEGVLRVRNYYLELLRLRRDLLACYEKEGGGEKVLAMKKQAEEELKVGEEFDFDGFLRQIGKEPTAIMSLGSGEEKRVRLRTSCLDYSSGPPQTGEKYFLISHTDEAGDGRYCPILRRAKSFEEEGIIQAAVWDVTFGQETSQINVKEIINEAGKDLGVPSLSEFYGKGEVGVWASSPGTVYDLDLVLKNYTDKEVTFDTSCLHFVPAYVYTEEQRRIFSDYARFYEQWYPGISSQSAVPVEKRVAYVKGPAVLGEQDKLPEPVPIPLPSIRLPKIKRYSQPLGSSGVVGRAAPFVRKLEKPEELIYNKQADAIERLDKSMRDFEKNPTEENFNRVMDDFSACQEARCPNLGATKERIDKLGKKVMTRQGLEPIYEE